MAVAGQALPNLPGSLRTVFAGSRETAPPVVKSERVVALPTEYVIEGNQAIKFEVVRDTELTVRAE